MFELLSDSMQSGVYYITCGKGCLSVYVESFHITCKQVYLACYKWTSIYCLQTGVLTLVLVSILAPLSNNSFTMLLLPRLDATCKGVMSFCDVM